MKPDGYYSDHDLFELGIKFGKNVLISKKASIYGNKLEVGDNVRIDDFCILIGDVKIGSYVHIASYCQLSGSSGITIEDFCGISSRSLLYSQSDDYSGSVMTGPLIDDHYKKVKKGRITLKKHSIIGAGSVILPQVTLEEGCAVGAMSLVSKNIEAWSVYAGVPAKRIKARDKNILSLEQEFLKSINK